MYVRRPGIAAGVAGGARAGGPPAVAPRVGSRPTRAKYLCLYAKIRTEIPVTERRLRLTTGGMRKRAEGSGSLPAQGSEAAAAEQALLDQDWAAAKVLWH